MQVIGDNQISEDVFDFIISYLLSPKKSIRSELAKLFFISLYTVETRYNAVLGVHRSDPRYIQVDGYNTVSPHADHKWPVSAFGHLVL